MKSLTETQTEELIAAIEIGDVHYSELVVVGRFICWQRNDTLRRLVECANNEQAHRILAAIRRLLGLPLD